LNLNFCFAQQSNELILEGLNSVYQDDFLKAESCFAKVIQRSPQEPQGYFFLAGLVHTEMMDQEDYAREKDFYENIQRSIELSKKQVQTNPKDAWAYLFLGNSYGYLAVYQGKKGVWWPALKDGLKAKSNLRKAIDLDPTLYDAYLGLGSYYYWSSVITKNFNWLPFLADKRKEGIEFLKISATKSTFSKEASINALVWVYINEGWYPLAIRHSQDMCETYPSGKIFLWALASAQYRSGDWQGAYASYFKLTDKIEQTQPGNHYNLIECRTKMANALYALGKVQESAKQCEKVLSYPIDEKLRKKQEVNLELARNLKKMCEQKL